jgi:RimJ/RimL family protein N-acetyltransferase
MIVETPRLLLRPWQDGDRAAFAAINADAEVRRYYYPSILSRAESDALIDEQIEHLRLHGFGFVAVQRKSDGALIGGAGLSRPGDEVPDAHAVEIGWIFGRDYWRQGYATEAALACFEQAWTRHGFADVIGYTSKINLPSQKAMEKVGMRPVPGGDFDDVTVPPGNPLRPHLLYRIARPGPAAR